MSYFLNKAGKDLFGKHVQQYSPPDPLYDYTSDTKGKKKRSKRPLPPGLSTRDAKILKSVQTRAHLLDKGFSLCGLRFGWSFLIALVPIAGSVADGVLTYALVIRKARQADIPAWLQARMVFNSAVGVGVSFVPIVGDVVLAVWKANSRNAVLLEEFLRIRGAEWLEEQQRQQAEREEEAERARERREASGDATAISTTTATEEEKKKKKKKGWSGMLLRWRGTSESDKPGSGTQPDEKKRNSPSAAADDDKAPPAGEKGRFVEHVPDHERWISTPTTTTKTAT
jgi:hypothetical protein